MATLVGLLAGSVAKGAGAFMGVQKLPRRQYVLSTRKKLYNNWLPRLIKNPSDVDLWSKVFDAAITLGLKDTYYAWRMMQERTAVDLNDVNTGLQKMKHLSPSRRAERIIARGPFVRACQDYRGYLQNALK